MSVSVGSQDTHNAWRNTDPKQGGLGPVKSPMVADVSKQIAREYDVLHQEEVAPHRDSIRQPDGPSG